MKILFILLLIFSFIGCQKFCRKPLKEIPMREYVIINEGLKVTKVETGWILQTHGISYHDDSYTFIPDASHSQEQSFVKQYIVHYSNCLCKEGESK